MVATEPPREAGGPRRRTARHRLESRGPDGRLPDDAERPGAPATHFGAPRTTASPSWSRDGAWVYFSSNREDGFQVWKMKPDPRAVRCASPAGAGSGRASLPTAGPSTT
ncbi:MAG: PD40 domain-containing protein [Holophagales bacterium]|nr:PD40 domain-containing protein [Holophagales bacterium]